MCSSHFSQNMSLTSLLSCLDNLTKQMTKESVFEKDVNHYLKSCSSQNQEAMVSALTDLLATNSSHLEKAKDARNTGMKKRLSAWVP